VPEPVKNGQGPEEEPQEPQTPPEGEAALAPVDELAPEVRQMADNYFTRAAQATVRSNFDYAIQLYLDGLRLNPRDVDQGHKGLRDCAMRRRNLGKGSGLGSLLSRAKGIFSQTIGRSKDAFFDLVTTLARDPQNVMLLSQIMQTARRLDYTDVAIWYGEVAAEETLRTKKPHKQIFTTLADMYEARKQYQKAVDALATAVKIDPADRTIDKRARDLAARASIEDSRLESITGFHDMILDKRQAAASATQQVIYTREQLDTQYEELKAVWEADPKNPAKVSALADCQARRGNIDEALNLLQTTFDETKEYRLKMRMDDIRMAEFRRILREISDQLRADPNQADLKAKRQQIVAERDTFEMGIFTERQKQYPTDTGIRYELGLRQYRTGQQDEAIMSFQQASRDPKRRITALNMLGRCFFAKKLYQEAQSQFEAAIQQYEMTTDPLAKELRYNLAITFEAQDKPSQAMEWYSVIVQQDYQYRDATKRLEALRKKASEAEGKS
jgi:tetratricopeptide (TPR) repeat protein